MPRWLLIYHDRPALEIECYICKVRGIHVAFLPAFWSLFGQQRLLICLFRPSTDILSSSPVGLFLLLLTLNPINYVLFHKFNWLSRTQILLRCRLLVSLVLFHGHKFELSRRALAKVIENVITYTSLTLPLTLCSGDSEALIDLASGLFPTESLKSWAF